MNNYIRCIHNDVYVTIILVLRECIFEHSVEAELH